MTEFQWKVVKALCTILLAQFVYGEDFTTPTARVRYKAEFDLLHEAESR